MDHLQQKYLEEAKDLLQELEQALLLLEENPENKSTAETIFRIMHTLKGSSSMFGFQKVGELTHLLENCFENLREGKANAGEELISLAFSSLDHIRHLLTDPELTNSKAKLQHAILLKQAIELYDEIMPASEDSLTTAVEQDEKTFFIWFKPQRGFMQNGSNPLYVLEDIALMGQLLTFINHHDLPPLEAIDPQQSYLTYGVLLSTTNTISTIQEAFLFVEHLCELDIVEIGKGNLIIHLTDEAKEKLYNSFATEIDKVDIRNFLEDISFALTEPVSQGTGELAKTDFVQEPPTSSIRVASDKLDDMMNLISELVASQARLSLLAEKTNDPALLGVAEEMEKISRQLRDKTFDICLIPIEHTLIRFKRLIRDLSKELNKRIVFEAEGTETELDKNVIEHLSDCLIHIFRNCIDHGIENEKERARKGKNPEGKILLKAYNSGANVVIEVQDDGAGVKQEKVKSRALEKGLITADQALSEKEVYDLLFHPGFSTANAVTAVSGRGVGMDVVRKKIKELRGEVNISSVVDKGTTISISIPLTISIMDGLLVRVGQTDFVLPLSFVEKSYAVESKDLEMSINHQLILNGELVPYFDLSSAFAGIPLKGYGFAIQISAGGKKMALLVEEIIGEYQAVLKPLGQFYKEVDFISGASLKGDGTVALVIDPQKLIEELSRNRNEV